TAESVSFYLDPARVICPHPGCHQPVRRPHYLCPNCGAVHKKLRPGRFGLFYRRCACQKARIPTLDILGRKDLEGICPHCSRNHDVRWLNAGTRSVSLVGGGYSGKTHFGLMAIQAFLREGGKAGQSLELLPIASNEAYQRGTALLNKGLALSEADVSGNLAFAVAREDYQRGSGALLVEDPGSDAYGDLITTARARLAPHADGYLFLIDPFSIREVSANFQQQITHLAGTIYPASDPPMLVYQRFRKAIHIAEKPGNLPRPIAVVVTKSDALALIAEGGAGFDLSNSLHPGSRPGTIRQWLIDQGEGNLVRTLESDFSEVSYFCASALGQLPDTGRPAQPAGVLAPLAWLLRSWNDAEGYLPGTNFWHKVPVRFAIGMLSALLLFGALGWGGGAIAGRYLQADQLAWAGEATEKFMGWIQDVEGMADQAIAEFSGPMGGFRFVRPYKGLNLRASPDANGALIKSLPRGTALVLKTDSTRRILRQDNWVSVATNFGDAGWVYAGPGWRNLALRDPASLRFRGDEKPEGPPEKDIREAITQYYKQLAERKGERELRTISQVKVLSAGEDRVEVEVRLVERDLASGEISLEKRDFELIEKEGWWVTKMR
ncbi:MAG TPA: SH3 domain-containing protein, partial [Calditrichia bacterium]|nr:SH3 domain-containing protein [Calditrichia bacterium]